MSTQDRGDERYGRLLEQLTARWTSDGQGDYLTDRYQERLLHAHRTASFARKQYRFGRWAIVGFASTAPTFQEPNGGDHSGAARRAASTELRHLVS